jgi:arylsulfatase A-like enzyme
MQRRDFLRFMSAASLTASAPAVLGGCGSSPSAPQGEQPNIVLIYTDDLGYADLGAYGDTEIQTPHIDQLAEEGMRFTDFCAASPVCTPARGGMLTGRYPQRNGLFENIRNNMVNYGHRYTEMEYIFGPEMTQGLDTREITIAEVLKDAGYRTGIVGKWDSGRAHHWLPLQRGFDFFYGFCNTGVDYWTHERYGIPSMYRGNERIKEEGYATQLFEREAVRFIEDNGEDPFFLYVPFNSPHGASNLEGRSHQAPEEYIAMYADPPGDSDARRKANITCMDDAVGSILDALDEQGMTENTLFIFTNDHGGYRNGDLRGTKGGMYEGGLRVPFIARWPGNIPEGTVSNEFCSALDLLPTFAVAAQTDPPQDRVLDGYNILPVLTEEGGSPRTSHFWELRGKRAARYENWKWVMETEERWVNPDPDARELFDLSSDIGEQNNLAEAQPDQEKQMRGRWEAWIREMYDSEPRGPFSKHAYIDLLGYGDGHYRLES